MPADDRNGPDRTGPDQCYLDDRSDELLQEGVLQQGRPVMVEEVDEQPFDVGAILVLKEMRGFSSGIRDGSGVASGAGSGSPDPS